MKSLALTAATLAIFGSLSVRAEGTKSYECFAFLELSPQKLEVVHLGLNDVGYCTLDAETDLGCEVGGTVEVSSPNFKVEPMTITQVPGISTTVASRFTKSGSGFSLLFTMANAEALTTPVGSAIAKVGTKMAYEKPTYLLELNEQDEKTGLPNTKAYSVSRYDYVKGLSQNVGYAMCEEK